MATNFPVGLDSYTTKVDNVDNVLAAHVNDLQSAVSALEAKVGVNSSAVTSTLDYKARNIPTQDTTTKVTNLSADKVDGADLSTDGTFAGNSDVLVPSQKAVKTYSDTKIASTYLDTDGTLAANSDTKIATQKAVKTYISNKATDAGITTSDVTTNDASTSKHGFLKKLSNVATEFMNGAGNWVAVTIDSILPSQTGNSGKFLTTNGSVSSWGSVSSVTHAYAKQSSAVAIGSGASIISVTKTITSGKSVLIVASGYFTMSNFGMGSQGAAFSLRHGSTEIQKVTNNNVGALKSSVWSCSGVVTDLSGSVTFSVYGTGTTSADALGGTISVLEF